MTREGKPYNWEMVQDALNSGHDTAASGIPFILGKYGVELTLIQFAATKSQIANTKKRQEQAGQDD